MKKLIILFHKIHNRIANKWWAVTTMKYYKLSFKKCGSNIRIAPGVIIEGLQNIEIGNNCYIGPGAIIYSTDASLIIGDDFICGPRLTVMTGDHRFDVVGKTINNTTEKKEENDKDIIIEEDVWCGANVTVLKGVRIGKGSVIAAGAMVLKDVPPYSIYISKDLIKRRFNDEQIKEHERLINQARKGGE